MSAHSSLMFCQKFYVERDRERQHELVNLREEITRLTVRLNEGGRKFESIERNYFIQSEKLAHYFRVKNIQRIEGIHPFKLWRRNVRYCSQNYLLERSSLHMYRSKVSFFAS